MRSKDSTGLSDRQVAPMLCKLARQVPLVDYAYEVKWDGVRAIAYVEPKSLRILSRNNLEITASYPELSGLSNQFPKKSAILDGEIVALNSEGLPDFESLQHRMHVRGVGVAEALSQTRPVMFMIFDLLYLDGVSMLDMPYLDRRKALIQLNLTGTNWSTPEHFVGDPQAFVEATRKMGIEGIVAKQCDSSYLPGKRTDAWLKVKHVLKQEFVVAGWQDGEGSRKGIPGALLLGFYDSTPAEAKRRKTHQKLVYAGKVGTGFSVRALHEIQTILQGNAIEKNPFEVDPPRERGTHFSRPELVAEIQFGAWTSGHILRHASFQGLRDDKAAADVVREV